MNEIVVAGPSNEPAVVRRVSKAGRFLGQRYQFCDVPASQIKARLKGDGLKGKALTRKVNEILTGKQDIRWAMFEVTASAIRSKGGVPDYVDMPKSGHGAAKAMFVIPPAQAPVVDMADIQAQLRALREENAALKAARA